MKKEDVEIIHKLSEAILEMSYDEEARNDTTSWCMTVKRPNKCPWHLKGCFTNFFLDKAFDEKDEDHKAAIEATKDQLWFAFKRCYLEKV